jgi:hypothetical protein
MILDDCVCSMEYGLPCRNAFSVLHSPTSHSATVRHERVAQNSKDICDADVHTREGALCTRGEKSFTTRMYQGSGHTHVLLNIF